MTGLRSNPTILIGGHGFLGRAFGDHLSVGGREVHVVARADWDNGRIDELARALDNRDAVVVELAYATVPSSSFADPVGDFTVNLGAIIRHLEFARSIGAGRFLFVSSGGTVYGDQGDRLLVESDPNQPISPYGITKLASEHYVAMYRRLDVPGLIVRPSNIYGPGQAPFRGQGLVATAFGKALAGEPVTLFGDGSQQRDYIFIDDMCRGLAAALDEGADGKVYNLGSGVGVSARDLLDAIGRISGRDGYPLTIEVAPTRPFDVASNLLDVTRMRDELGVTPRVGLEQGLEETWRWIRNR